MGIIHRNATVLAPSFLVGPVLQLGIEDGHKDKDTSKSLQSPFPFIATAPVDVGLCHLLAHQSQASLYKGGEEQSA